jgi:hypothetical protein
VSCRVRWRVCRVVSCVVVPRDGRRRGRSGVA